MTAFGIEAAAASFILGVILISNEFLCEKLANKESFVAFVFSSVHKLSMFPIQSSIHNIFLKGVLSIYSMGKMFDAH